MIRKLFLRFCRVVLKTFLSLRYRIEVTGKDVVKDSRYKNKGVLVLPNHPSEVDPLIILMLLWVDFDLIPLVAESFYHNPFTKFFMRLVKARPVAEFDKAVSDFKIKSAEKLFKDIVDDLNHGAHVLLYPGGGLKVGPEEKIGGRSLAHSTVQSAPDAEILLVRTTGLWGSLFSKAYTQKSPNFWRTLCSGFYILLKNLLFFTPRRRVKVDFSHLPEDFPKYGSKGEFNRALEKFYNNYLDFDNDDALLEKEPLHQIPYYFWSKKVPEVFIKKNKTRNYNDNLIPKHIRQDIMCQLSELSGKAVADITDSSDLIYDLGLDSLNIASIYTYMDSNYDIAQSVEPGELHTVEDLFDAATHLKNKKTEREFNDEEHSTWSRFKGNRKDPKFTNGTTIIEMFLNSCDKMKGSPACADESTCELSYSKMKLAIIILANKFQKLEGNYIGVLLPSSIGAYLIILACMLAGKVPVPLNWTIGSFFTNHAIDLLNIKNIISSEKFINKLDNVDLGNALSKLMLIEDLKKTITLKDKINGVILSKRDVTALFKKFKIDKLTENNNAIALFTSGTTALPKCVILTHKNIVTNLTDSMKCFEFLSSDVLINALPPFHIFGLILGVLPLLLGIRVLYSPDPLDGSKIAKQILKWRVTIIIMAPTFYANLFRVATLNQLKSLRIFISGAEAAPSSLVEFVKKLGDVWFLEGYGLTETSPIISVNNMYKKPNGVGQILSSVDLIIVEPESGQKLLKHQIGEICVRGDSVFSGYYKQDNSDVFIDVDGKKYFRTGDLGYYDENGYLYLSARLKNTIKKGGELINLTAIEFALFNKAKERGWISQDINHMPFACIPKLSSNGSSQKVVLFSEIDIPLDKANNALIESGFSRLYKINEVVKIDEIPMLKTGKICYRKLFEMKI